MQVNMKHFTVILLFVTISLVTTKNIPSFIQKCKYTTSEEVSKCILQRIIELKPRLAKGIPELKIPPMEPFFLPRMEINTEIGLHAIFTNITIHGFTNLQITELNYDFEGRNAYVHFFLPSVQADAICNFDVNAPILTLSSSGIAHGNLTDIDVKGNRKFTTVKKNKRTYLKMEDEHDQEIKYGKANVYFEKLFGDNEELTEHINQIINENFDEIAKNLAPLIYESVVSIAREIVQNFWNEYSIEESFD